MNNSTRRDAGRQMAQMFGAEQSSAAQGLKESPRNSGRKHKVREKKMKSGQSFASNILNWFDSQGKLAWIAFMVVAFILFWPIGLAILFFLLGSGRLSNGKPPLRYRYVAKSTGNSAFDDYRAETLRRLEEEQEAFLEHLQRLRDAKDQAEFDRFMSDRNKATDST